MRKKNQVEKVAALENFGCFVMVENGSLYNCPMLNNGEPDCDNGKMNWIDVTEPSSQEFLDECNAALGTNFKIDQFSGQ